MRIDTTGKYAFNPDNNWWYFKHPDGQWVTLRKANDREVEEYAALNRIEKILGGIDNTRNK